MENKNQETVELQVSGMHCNNCALSVTRLLEQRGLTDVYVNFATGEVRFHANGNLNTDAIIKGIENLGYKAVLETGETNQETSAKKYSPLEIKFFVCALFTLPLALSMFLPFEFLHRPLVQLLLCLPVYVIGFLHFGKSAWGSVKSGLMNMDVLIFIGSTAAFVYSLIGTVYALGMEYSFYETAATIITLVLLGNVIEHRSVKRTTSSILALQKLQPEKATRIKYDITSFTEVIEEVPVKELRLHELLQVNTGDKIPLDGIVVSGEAYADESMITGESLPVHKKKDDAVTGGTIVHQGNIRMKVSAMPENSVLAGIIQLVKQAQIQKPPIQKIADKISAWFVPIVLTIACLTFVVSYFVIEISLQQSLLNSIAVLVISCPCAMGLATPTAIMVGIGRSAQNGILIKGGSTLESFAKTNTIIFDKTGTLTTGKFSVSGFTVFNGNEAEITNSIHHIENNSSHPIAKSLSNHFQPSANINLKNIQEMKGVGMQATDENGVKYAIGSANIGVNLPAGFDIYFLKDNILQAAFHITDELKPFVQETISYFHSKNIETILLSGDSEKKCKLIAEQTGIQKYFSDKSPQEKTEIVKQLSATKNVTMFGDGINDAPALALANTGISMSNATQVAMNAAQVVLLNGNLQSLQKAHQLGSMTLTTVKQNLFWAFFYNVLAIPVAAAGFLNPMIAALSMAFSDVIVIGNSLRLHLRKIR